MKTTNRKNTEKKSNLTDMTVGSPLGHILTFALPLLIGNIFQQLYNMVDSLVVGNYVSSNALAAVGTCGAMSFLFFSLSSGLAIGIGIMVSQYFGAKDESRIKDTISNSIYILIGSAILVSIIAYIYAPAILKILNTPDIIIGDSIIYMRTLCFGIIAIALYNGVASILRALGDSKTPLYFLILSCIVNIVLDLLLVLVYGMGVYGVALATVISQYISMIISVIYAYIKVPYFHLSKEDCKPKKNIIISSFKIGIPVALQSSLIAISMMVLQGVVNSFGPVVMAAYTVVSRIESIVNQPYSSLQNAITNYSGQNMGANNIKRVKKGFSQSIIIVLIFSLILLPTAYFFGETVVGWFVKEPEVIEIGAKALRITSLCYFALGMIYVPRGVLNGCGDTTFSMINGISEVACRIIFSNVLTKIPVIGYWGIWITTGVTWVINAIVCLIRYKNGRWKFKRIISNS